MAFEGDLSNLSLGDVLQTIAMSRQVGTFIIRGAEERRLGCGPNGVALLSSRTSLGLRIGTVLVGTGKTTQDQIDRALRVQRRRRDMMIGQLLVTEGVCTEDDLRGARRYLAMEEIFDLFMWKEGKFEFLAGEPDAGGPFADLWFDVGSLAMEAARRLDELPRALEAVPQNEVYVPLDVANEAAGKIENSRDLSALMRLCDGTRTVEDIADAHYRGRFDTWKGMETLLLELKALRPATKDEILEAARAASSAREHARAARLFRRAAEHDPSDDAIRMAVADALRDSGEKRRAAEQLVHVADGRLAAGKGLPAVEAYRQAISLDAANADANEGLMRALAESGQVEEAVAAAHATAALRISIGDYAGACRVAEAGLAQAPGDVQLMISLANANQGLGRSADAVRLLDDVAQVLEAEGSGDRRLVDVYRRILQIDPDRKDCLRRIDEIQAFERTRRKRLMHRVAIAAGLLIFASAGVIVFRPKSVESQIAAVQALLDSKSAKENAKEALELIEELERRDLDEDQQIEINVLKTRADQLEHPPASVGISKALDEAVDEACAAAARAMKDDQIAEGLRCLLVVLEVLERPEMRKLKALDAVEAERLRAQAAKELHNALGNAAGVAQTVAQRVTSMRDRFDPNVFFKDDVDVLKRLIDESSQVIESTKVEAWAGVGGLLQTLADRMNDPALGGDRRILDPAATVVEAHREVCKLHDRALARLRRKEVKDAFVAAHTAGTNKAQYEGRIEDAIAVYDPFLKLCEELRKAQPEELYAPIIKELFGPEMQLDQRIKTRRDGCAAILASEEEAQRAENAGDYESAFRVYKRLVEDNRDIVFSNRFKAPVRIETAPPGAEVFLLDGTPNGQNLGRSPVQTHHALEGESRFEIRLAGYRDHSFVREGLAKDPSGLVRVELAKLPTWKSQPVGVSQAPVRAARGSIVVATRTGVILRMKNGEEARRFDAKNLAGFAGTPVVRGDYVFAVTLDGKGYVLGLENLNEVATFQTGPARAAPLETPFGVVVADEAGVVRLVNDAGRIVWSKQIGTVRGAPAPAGERGERVLVVTVDGEALLFDAATGEILRRRQLKREGMTWGAPIVRGRRAFVADDAGTIVCLDATTLVEVWSRELEGRPCGSPCATDLRLLVNTAKGVVNVLDAETGAHISRVPIGAPLEVGPCDLPDGGFVVVTKSGWATRFDPKGSIVWRFEAGEPISAPPRFVRDDDGGQIILVTLKGVVISLKP
jgi:tetratricopeptide (TPR) repeat protein